MPPPRLPDYLRPAPVSSPLGDREGAYNWQADPFSTDNVQTRPLLSHCLHRLTRPGPNGTNIDPPGRSWMDTDEFLRLDRGFSQAEDRQQMTARNAQIDTALTDMFFPENVFPFSDDGDETAPPAIRIPSFARADAGELPVLERESSHLHRAAQPTSAMPPSVNLSDIPRVAMDMDVDRITVEYLEVSARIIEILQESIFHLVAQDHTSAADAAERVERCGRALSRMISLRRDIVEGRLGSENWSSSEWYGFSG